VLVGVVGIGIVGRGGTSSPLASTPPILAVAPSARIEAPPAAVPGAPLGIPWQHDREEGTDGLMGGLAFGLPGDTPLVRRERLNRFTIDDAHLTVSRPVTTPPWVRGTSGSPALTAGPYER
jgi:hypothetical protein